MKKLPDLMSEFNGMMAAMDLQDCPEPQRMDMLRAFVGGACIAARDREDEEMLGHIYLFGRSHIDS